MSAGSTSCSNLRTRSTTIIDSRLLQCFDDVLLEHGYIVCTWSLPANPIGDHLGLHGRNTLPTTDFPVNRAAQNCDRARTNLVKRKYMYAADRCSGELPRCQCILARYVARCEKSNSGFEFIVVQSPAGNRKLPVWIETGMAAFQSSILLY